MIYCARVCLLREFLLLPFHNKFHRNFFFIILRIVLVHYFDYLANIKCQFLKFSYLLCSHKTIHIFLCNILLLSIFLPVIVIIKMSNILILYIYLGKAFTTAVKYSAISLQYPYAYLDTICEILSNCAIYKICKLLYTAVREILNIFYSLHICFCFWLDKKLHL